eukprot:1467920-Prymnesium_polylepis.1
MPCTKPPACCGLACPALQKEASLVAEKGNDYRFGQVEAGLARLASHARLSWRLRAGLLMRK